MSPLLNKGATSVLLSEATLTKKQSRQCSPLEKNRSAEPSNNGSVALDGRDFFMTLLYMKQYAIISETPLYCQDF